MLQIVASLLAGLQPRLDGFVLLVEVGQVGHQVLHHILFCNELKRRMNYKKGRDECLVGHGFWNLNYYIINRKVKRWDNDNVGLI